MPEITITLSDEAYGRLAVLADPGQGLPTVERVIEALADHAQQGIGRPGSWERPWLCEAFGDDWLEWMEPDPDHAGTGWMRPRRGDDD